MPVGVEKGRVGRRPRTWLSITPHGASAYQAHLTALRDIAAQDIPAQASARQKKQRGWTIQRRPSPSQMLTKLSHVDD